MENDAPNSVPLPERSTFEWFVVQLADGTLVNRRAEGLVALPPGAHVVRSVMTQ